MLKPVTLGWMVLIAVYGLLALKNYSVWKKLRALESEGDSTLFLTPSGIGINDEPYSEHDVDVTSVFKSIMLSDLAALLLGVVGVLLTLQ